MTSANPLTTLCSTQVLIGDKPLHLSAFTATSGNVHVGGIAPHFSLTCDDLTTLRRLANGLMTLADAFETGDGVELCESTGHRRTSVSVGEPLVLGLVD